jgi:hypothetical protein
MTAVAFLYNNYVSTSGKLIVLLVQLGIVLVATPVALYTPPSISSALSGNSSYYVKVPMDSEHHE